MQLGLGLVQEHPLPLAVHGVGPGGGGAGPSPGGGGVGLRLRDSGLRGVDSGEAGMNLYLTLTSQKVSHWLSRDKHAAAVVALGPPPLESSNHWAFGVSGNLAQTPSILIWQDAGTAKTPWAAAHSRSAVKH